MNVVRTLPVVLAFMLAGCFGTEVTEFPDGLEPLGMNDLAGPGTASDPHPEEFVTEATDGGRYDLVLGRGFINAPITEVWAAYRNPAVGADRRTSPDWTSDPLDEAGYDESYVIHHIAYDVVTVEWDVTWRHGVVTGTAEVPELVSMRWQKTNGSTLISVIEGSILLRPAGDGSVTEVELVYHASAAGSGPDTYARYMQEVYNDAVAITHGNELATFE